MRRNANRLDSGGIIDRTRPLAFRFDGRLLRGCQGDTLASALLANGIKIVGRSFKLHRPRGITGFACEDPGGIVQIVNGSRSIPNARAAQTDLVDGLVATSVNGWPNARWDIGAALGLLSPLLPAGFYYKTFKWPSWRFYEPIIRRLAGLGRVPTEPDPDRYDREYLHCDILVVGAGAAGLAAAVAAARAGAETLIADEGTVLEGADPDQRRAVPQESPWIEATLRELRSARNVRLLARATAFGYYDHNLIAISQRRSGPAIAERICLVRPREVILATGAIEQPLVFPGNDRPGVMLASAVHRYLHRYAVVAGRRAAVFTNNDTAYEVAFDLHGAGTDIAAIIDTREQPPPALLQRAQTEGIPVHAGSSVSRTFGGRALRSIAFIRYGRPRAEKIDCDLLCVSGGWAPNLHLFSQSGGALVYDERGSCFTAGSSVQRLHIAGAARRHMELEACIADGAAQGQSAARNAGFLEGSDAPLVPPEPRGKATTGSAHINPSTWPFHAQREAFVDLMSDVAVSDIALAVREGYHSVEHLKRYTTLGMSADQGKTSNLNGLTLLGQLTDRSPATVGTTRFRAPYAPVTLGALAGRFRGALFSALRRLPTHELQCEAGATLEELSGWLRPAWYGENPAADSAARREALCVRNCAGLMDYSPIGKFEISGPDASLFLERIYAAPIESLRVGGARYGIMLNRNGIVIDDGIVARLSQERFFVTVTSGHAGMIAEWLDMWHQCEWPDLRVIVSAVTTAYAALLLAGPHARAILSSLEFDFATDGAAFPHMTVREGTLGTHPVRVLRTGFTGEVGFEIYTPWRRAAAVWRQILAAGAAHGLRPFGIDALLMLRLEKGYIHVGVDTDATSMPDDLGMAGMVQRKSTPFIGMQAIARPRSRDPDRWQLVGFEPVRGGDVLHEGAQVLGEDGTGRQGSITSSCISPTLGRSIAMGVLKAGRTRREEIVQLHHDGRRVAARVTAQNFFDPCNERLRDVG